MNDQHIEPRPLPRGHRIRLAAAGVALLAIGGVAGTVAGHALQPPIEMAPLRPVAISSLPSSNDSIVTIRGRVAGTFGNKFVIDDGTARTLVDTGPTGDDTRLVTDGTPVTVQGRFDRGFVRASFLVDPAGKVTALGPLGGPPHDRRGPPPPHRGDGPPPPPPGNAPPPPPPPQADATAAAPAPAPATTVR